MDLSKAADHLVLLSDSKRLAIVHKLAEAGEDGLLIREIASQTELTTGSVRNQIKHLTAAGMVKTKKKGRKIYCWAVAQEINDFVDLLSDVLRPRSAEEAAIKPYVFNLEPEPVSPKKSKKKKGYRSLRDRLSEMELAPSSAE